MNEPTVSKRLPDEVVNKLINGTCKKCEWRKTLSEIGSCPYQYGLNNDKTACSALKKTSYWVRKDKDAIYAERRSRMIEKGIIPKFIVGQTVYEVGGFGSWGERYVQEATVRELYPDENLEKWIYKISTHLEYSFYENQIFATQQECQEHIIKMFMEQVKNQANRLAREANRYGLVLGEHTETKLLENIIEK